MTLDVTPRASCLYAHLPPKPSFVLDVPVNTLPPRTRRTSSGMGTPYCPSSLIGAPSQQPTPQTSTDMNANSPILRTPNEILIKIARELDGAVSPQDYEGNCYHAELHTQVPVNMSRDIRNLALTCRQFRSIAQETLICRAVIPIYNLAKFIRTVSQHLDVIPKFTHLRLGSSPWKPIYPLDPEDLLKVLLDTNLQEIKTYCGIIKTAMNAPAAEQWRRWSWTSVSQTDAITFCLLTIFAMSTNLTKISIRTKFLTKSHLMQQLMGTRPLHPWLCYEHMIPMLRANIKKLNIHLSSRAHPFRPLVDLQKLPSLTHLSLPIFKMDWRDLPTRLVHLQLYRPHTELLNTLSWLTEIAQDSAQFPSLRLVAIFIQQTCRDSISEVRHAETLAMLKYLETSHMQFAFLCLRSEYGDAWATNKLRSG
ncbi:hypothetical protein BDV95DRAFT_51992 [Massariosphaeria phaeospora]|uniref:F-box domain-containing protein n=1 Tax=Massariosphaeria phaeospora TaxID=100035 RepID=A0A7C8MJS0_9PLEO|nr:hypothetical protein BDV95DRAFT_51992 [Massariosphaeria phaeospora]